MPSTYAHTAFGREVFKLLSQDLKRIVKSNLDAFHTGLHGPDILFYYGPFSKNHVNQLGYGQHEKPAEEFLVRARRIVKKTSDTALYAYIIGFICHFMLDSECHGYIGQKIAQSDVTHAEIEVEFDRHLLVEQGINPITYDPAEYLCPTPELSAKIALLYPPVTGEEVYKAIRSMKSFNRLLVCKNAFKRSLIYGIMNITGTRDVYGGLIVNLHPNPQCADSCDRLTTLFNKALTPTARIIEEFCAHMLDETPLDDRFKRNFE